MNYLKQSIEMPWPRQILEIFRHSKFVLVKDQFLYYILSNLQDCSTLYTLLLGRPVQSNSISAAMGNIQYSCVKIIRTQMFTIVYCRMLIQLYELGQCRVKKVQCFIQQYRVWTWILLVEGPMVYPWATVLLHMLSLPIWHRCYLLLEMENIATHIITGIILFSTTSC